jgi:predicted O-methyltransferase YrrM
LNTRAFLATVHELLRPRTYLEIGVRRGGSLALSRARSIAVDPAFKITVELQCDLELVRETSDTFFSRVNPLAHFNGQPLDLAYVDGLHHSEVTLEDFRNVERLSAPTSVVLLDDILPRSSAEAAREQRKGRWAGDVFKVALVLERYRPDLVCIQVATRPMGILLVLGLDAANRVLEEKRDGIRDELVTSDPQDVPEEILDRRRAVDPASLLRAGFWSGLVELRDRPDAVPEDVRLLAVSS